MNSNLSILKFYFLILSVVIIALSASDSLSKVAPDTDTEQRFNRIISLATHQKWHQLPIGEIVVLAGREMLGTPYVASTLESKGDEVCTVNLMALDCVTFFENALCMARVIKRQESSFEELYADVTFTRYRSGILDGYTSRLHYTADWIKDNIAKSTIDDVTMSLGGEKINFNLNFMSSNVKYYPQLVQNPELVNQIKFIEISLNSTDFYIIPNSKVASIESKLLPGDIIAIATSKSGLDYSHVGLIYRDKSGKARFMHASSTKKEVIIDATISRYLSTNSSSIGITVLRPRNP